MAEKRSATDWIKGVVVSLGTVATGIWIMHGPQSMREEIPVYREIGMGTAAFGALFFAALFVTRAKSLLLFFVVGAISAGTGFVAWAGPDDMDLWFRLLLGVLAFFAGIFAIFCLIAVFTGDDPAET